MNIPILVPDEPRLDQIYLLTEAFCCAEAPTVISTTLGSCVSVCLWDCVRHIGGMNHFVLPTTPAGNASRSLRYGDVSIQVLLESMDELGSRIGHLRASVFGGANVLPVDGGRVSIGSLNIALALGRLAALRIPVMTQDTGGSRGMMIRFRTDTGATDVQRLSGPTALDRRLRANP